MTKLSWYENAYRTDGHKPTTICEKREVTMREGTNDNLPDISADVWDTEKKRFRITGGGALRRMSSGKRHLNLHKSSTRIHRLGAWLALAAPAPAPSRQPALP